MPKTKYAIGIDLGGSFIKAGLVNHQGKILKKSSLATETRKGQKQVIKNIVEAVKRVYQPGVLGIGIGSPGPFLNLEKGILGKVVNLPLYKVNLKKILTSHFSVPNVIDNDANCFVFGETLYGAGKNYQVVGGLTLGTGVGSGLVINQKIYHGRGSALEFGHTILNIEEKRFSCSCGNYGCLESYLGAKGVKKIARSFNLKIKNGKELHNLALTGDKKARIIWQKFGQILGIGLTNFIHAFDPEIIILGGSVSRAWRFFYPSLTKEVKNRALFNPKKIAPAKNLDSAILGAGALIFPKNNIKL